MLNVATAKSRTKNAGDDHRSRAGHDAALAVRAQPSSSAVPHASNILEMNHIQRKSSRSLCGNSSSEDRQSSKLKLLNLPSPQPSTATMQLGMMKKPSRSTEESEWLFAGLDDYEQALLRGAWKAAYDAQQQREQGEADHEGGASGVWSNHSLIFSKSQSEDEDGLQFAASVAHEDATSPIASGKSNGSSRRSSRFKIAASDKDQERSQAGDCARRAKMQSPSRRDLREEKPVSLSELLWILILSVRQFTIYPHWRTFRAWELLVVSLVVFNGIMLPFELAFWTETGSPEAVQRVNRVADAIFWADLLQNFFVAHIDTWGTLHTDKRVIARAYVSSWFMIDLVACVPFELFVPGYLVSASDLLKCVRLLRLAKILRFLDRLQFAAATRIVRLFFTVLLLCHWVACLWYRLGMIWLERGECDLAQTGDITHGRSSPLHRMRHCSWVIEQAENRLDASLVSPYLRSLYWSIATIMTVGYGDIVPVNVVEHILYIFVTVIGAGVYAHVFSTIVRVLERANALSNQYASVMEDTQAQMTYLRFPASLRNKIFAYYGNVFDKQKYMLSGGGPFYKNLPRPLALACTEALFFEKLEKIDFLHDCTSAFLLELCSSLNRVICIPGQAIIRQGEASDAWFIIESGRCRVERHGPSFRNALEEAKVEDGNVPTSPGNVPYPHESDRSTSTDVDEDGHVQELRVLGQGDHFGEIGLLTGNFRTATVRAIEFCELNYISVLRFYTLLGRFQVDNKQILHNCVSMLRQPKTAGKPNNMDSAVFLRPRPSLSRQQASKDELDSGESAQAERGA